MKRFIIATLFLVQSLCLFAASSAKTRALREQFIAGIEEQLGKPYEFGGIGPDTFDCSGLIYYVSRTYISKQMPRTCMAMYRDSTNIQDDQKEPGDLLFFRTTTGGTISHVGVYIGDNKFISSLSDGVESGVAVSDLNSAYWRDKYVGAGRFIYAEEKEPEIQNVQATEEPLKETEQKVVKKTKTKEPKEVSASKKAAVKKNIKEEEEVRGNVSDNIIIDASVFFDWSLLSPRQFVFRYRGIDALAHVRYAGWELEPGLGIGFRYNYGLKTMQMPVTLSMNLNDFVSLYAGPVLTFGDVQLIDTDKNIKASIFPGVVGASFTTPAYEWKGLSFHGVQDVSYTIYNNLDGSTLNFMEGIAAGLVMYTGVKIAFPVSIFGSGK